MNPPARLVGLIPAAGTGSRLGAPRPKQYLPLGGATMLEHAIRAMKADLRVSEVIVVVAPEDSAWQTLPAMNGVRFASVGGASRAESVRKGLAAIDLAEHDWVLVHDAARPCLPREDLRALIDAVQHEPVGGLLALPMADTVKRARDGRVAQTIDRTELWRALTPQMFRAGLLRRALEGDLAQITDEASAIERLGHAPLLVAGSPANLKVTTAADLPLAEAILRAQQTANATGSWT